MARWQDEHDTEYGLPPVVWPPALRQPVRPPRLLYLDLNHWIGLAQARAGRGSPAYQRLDDSLRRALDAERIRVVLGTALFREIGKIADPAQRSALTAVIEKVTSFVYLLGVLDLRRLELQAVLDATTGTTGLGYGPIDLLGRSALHSMGRAGGLRIMQDGEDVTERLLAEDPEWRARLAEMERLAEQMLLAGPADADIPQLRANGYQPEIPEQAIRDNAAYEQDWSARVAAYRNTHGVRDLVIARHLALEFMPQFAEELPARGLGLEQVIVDRAAARRLVLAMPTSAVTVSLIAQYHQNPQKTWAENDLYDIDALAVAVPYCDLVLTDRAARDALQRRGLDAHFDTRIPRDPEELATILDACEPPGAGDGES